MGPSAASVSVMRFAGAATCVDTGADCSGTAVALTAWARPSEATALTTTAPTITRASTATDAMSGARDARREAMESPNDTGPMVLGSGAGPGNTGSEMLPGVGVK